VGFGGFGPLGDRGGGCCGRGPGHGFGPGGGGALARHVARAPEVIPGTATVPQSLDKEIVRRVIRRHLQEVRFCYERELGRRPDLYGRVVARFVIAPSGDVLASNIESSTMAAPAVEGCVADAIRRWQFPPSPSHAAAVVTYPFVLKRAGAE